MRKYDRPFCPSNDIEGGLLARVGAIDQNTHLPHLINHILASHAERRRRVK